MTRARTLSIIWTLTLGVSFGCQVAIESEPTDNSNTPDAGVSGGSPNTGGSDSITGGENGASGGIQSTGGKPNPTGGATATGGSASSGGNPSTGGSSATGGQSATGGVATTGGQPNTGGTSTTGGASTGGSAGGGTGAKGYLSVKGSGLVDSQGRAARITGVNWFGFETSNKAPHGLWSRDYRSMLKQIKAVGFNALRIPWSNAIMESGAQPGSISYYGTDGYDNTNPINGDLKGKTALEVLDSIITEAGKLGLRVILDNHSRKPDAYMTEDLWYTADFSEQRWISEWVSLAKRYANNPTVVGFDLDNEPHDNARWGEGTSSTNWNAAAEKCGNEILKVNSNALIIVEGVEDYKGTGYWWGGNLKGVKDYPIRLSNPAKLVYSPHEYGPEVHMQTWFSDASYPSNLRTLWDDRFGFIMRDKLAHTLVGEFGIRDKSASNGKAWTWFTEFLKYAGSTYSWTFWCWNPNSGDTGGILQDDWVHVQQWKVDALKPHFAAMIPAQ